MGLDRVIDGVSTSITIRSGDVTPRSCATKRSRTVPAAAAGRRFL